MAAGYGVAQEIGDQARRLAEQAAQATDPEQAAQLQEQASQLTNGARQMADAVGSSFAAAVAHTSLVGAAILGVGAMSVALLLPGKGRGAKAGAANTTKAGEGIRTSAADLRARPWPPCATSPTPLGPPAPHRSHTPRLGLTPGRWIRPPPTTGGDGL